MASTKLTMPSSPTSLFFVLLTSAVVLSGCGGTGAATAMISGNVSGLSAGNSVALENNGKQQLIVAANGSFYFNGQVQGGTPYSVTVAINPTGESCLVQNGSGIVGQYSQDVTNIEIVCEPGVGNVFGYVTGLATGAVVGLENNDALPGATGLNTLSVKANGQFIFPSLVQPGFTYNIAVSAQPAGQTCVVTNGSGTMPTKGSIVAVDVTCN